MSREPSVSWVAPAMVLGVSLAIGLIVLGYFVAAAVMEGKRGDRTVCVQGAATIGIQASRAIWSLPFTVRAPDPAALSEKLEAATQEIRQFLLTAGFAAEEITSGPVATERSQEPGQSTAWVGHGAVVLETSAVDKLVAAWALTPRLLAAGIGLCTPISTPEFFFIPSEATLASVWQAADRAAYQAALRFGDDTGQALGGLRRAEHHPLEWLPQREALARHRLMRATTTAEYFLR